METATLIALAVLFVSIAVVVATVSSLVLARLAPERRRLRELATVGPVAGPVGPVTLAERPDPISARVSSFIPKSPKEMSKLQRRLAKAGYEHAAAPVIYSASEMLLPVVCGLLVLLYFQSTLGAVFALLAAVVGYTLPGFWVANRTAARQKQIRHGLPDALDLMVVCVEAGSGLDHAVAKTSEELALAHPVLCEQLRYVITEIKAGKPRMEAFKNFASRTAVDEVRSLVAMLVQTDRFGTSVAQALRTHAQVSRTTRRQQAEERAAKLGVKMVFPLVFFLFPAMYVVVLGPAVIKILEFMAE
jgi:tight adherence protein C